ncbi:acyltransferase [Microvenator marinus]|uniref:Acyltransferase n=1 Tax=Microvenator marinus TaxID=2600177 RepID=A0A5B8XSQ6_9DELT|nr:acyltransferase [Microvenator marinus]QED28710.1 acyltransferase [Microvenator marinus]
MKYRPEIDGLRALAVVPVILFHAGFELFSGGYVGVDVFFVISGFLITTLLIEDIEHQRFSMLDFYKRRARRIFPALFFVMLICVPFAWTWMLPSQFQDFSQSLVAVSLFASNMLFWRESGYFDAVAEEKPLLHTWSLAVEEQYYVLFPIFLLLTWRFGKRRVFWVVLAMATISLAVSEWGWRNAPAANFYLAPTRAWELLAGSIAAFIVQERGVRKNNALAFLGLAAILFAILAFDESTPFPSVYALIPVVGVVLLLLYGHTDTIVARLLSRKGLVGVGLISYSAYLWHQPLFAFARIKLPEEPSAFVMACLSVASLLLARVSWRYVENPFRRAKDNKRIFGASAFAIAGFVGIGLIGHFNSQEFEDYWLSKQPREMRDTYRLVKAAQGDTSIDPEECRFNIGDVNSDIETRLSSCYDQFGAGVLILGDSHANDLFNVTASKFDERFLVGITQGGCRPHSNFDYCNYSKVMNLIRTRSRIFKLVIFEQAGFYLLKKEDGTPGSRGIFSNLGMGEGVEEVVVDEEHVQGTFLYLKELSNMVPVKWFLPRAEPHIRTNFILKNGCTHNYSYRMNQYEAFHKLDRYIERLIRESTGHNIQPSNQNYFFRFEFPQDFMNCSQLFWKDGDHFSPAGVSYFGSRLPDDFLSVPD